MDWQLHLRTLWESLCSQPSKPYALPFLQASSSQVIWDPFAPLCIRLTLMTEWQRKNSITFSSAVKALCSFFNLPLWHIDDTREFWDDWTRIIENTFYMVIKFRTQWLFGCLTELWCCVHDVMADVCLPYKLCTTNPSLPAKWNCISPMTEWCCCVKGVHHSQSGWIEATSGEIH